MNLSDFDYHLPPDLIAQEPATPRDHSRLLVYERVSGRITDDYFYNLPGHLMPGTTLVMNNSRVEKARLLFGNTEVFILRQFGTDTVEALVRPGRKFRPGRTTALTDDISVETLAVEDDGTRRIRFSLSLDDPRIDPFRFTPFPPYIRQNEDLASRYQTVIARHDGSKAAPTAGLHFTDELLSRLAAMGIPKAEITLHVGLGTFAPVKTENVDEHRLHEEWYQISRDAADQLNSASHITAVGTTTARVLESAAKANAPGSANNLIRESSHGSGSESAPQTARPEDQLRSAGHNSSRKFDTQTNTSGDLSPLTGRHFEPCEGSTDIFIRPGYRFRGLDQLITNFHLPKSTLLMMIAALMGYEEMRQVYDHAIREKYRFYSFGDAMLIK
ncbi:MAG: S-adenosylmethionine:tRNA ribosyltransferase-isomerase [Rhodothermaceae bacterium]|nr:S-adenosylmethionine:tRNA ribosyltransferase-isomerase [Rhodothermaceae bacterium]